MDAYLHILKSIEAEGRAAFVFSEEGDLQTCNDAANGMLEHLDPSERETISGHLEKQCKTHLVLGDVAEKSDLDLFLPNPKGEYVCHKLSLLAIRYRDMTAYVAIFSDLPFSTGDGLRFSGEEVNRYDPLEDADALEGQVACTKTLPLWISRAKENRRRLALFLVRFKSSPSLKFILSQDLQQQLITSVRGKLKEWLGNNVEINQLDNESFLLFKELENDSEELGEILDSLDGLLLASTGHDGNAPLEVNVGAAEYPRDGRDSVSLLSAVDIAFAVSMDRGVSQTVQFAAPMKEVYERRLLVEKRLARAVSDNIFELRLQPIVSFADGQYLGYEVNIHWNDPVLGVVALDEFMPIAEETGLFMTMYDWLFGRVFTIISSGLISGVLPGKITVPVSALLFRGDRLLNLLRKNMYKDEVINGSLVLELSERLLFEDNERVLSVLAEIKSMGIKLSLKKFGEESSPLQCIHAYPLDYVKIAPSLVQRINDSHTAATLCSAIIQTAHLFKLTVIAEGVENGRQQDILQTLLCDHAQGSLFSELIAEDQLADHQKYFAQGTSNEKMCHEEYARQISSKSYLSQLEHVISRLLGKRKKK